MLLLAVEKRVSWDVVLSLFEFSQGRPRGKEPIN
jgi:hypothetical protein